MKILIQPSARQGSALVVTLVLGVVLLVIMVSYLQLLGSQNKLVIRSESWNAALTMAEAGVPGYEFTTWHGIWVPKSTPRTIVELLNDRLKKMMAAPDQQKRFQERGLQIIASSPEEFAAHVQR